MLNGMKKLSSSSILYWHLLFRLLLVFLNARTYKLARDTSRTHSVIFQVKSFLSLGVDIKGEFLLFLFFFFLLLFLLC